MAPGQVAAAGSAAPSSLFGSDAPPILRKPACDGESLLVVENNFSRHIEVVELQKTGTAGAVASLAPGERTTVRLAKGPENRYEARAVGR